MRLRDLPSVDVLLGDGRLAAAPRPLALAAARTALERAREEVRAGLDPGDLVLLYTDGVTEAGQPDNEIGEAGLARLLAELAGRTPEEIVAAVEHAAVAAQEGHPRDDIALVALRLEA